MKEFVSFCPACGSAAVESSFLSGGQATCKACEWSGSREDLMQVPLEHEFSSQEEMLIRFIKQLATVIAKSSAVEIGRVLLQWGFVDQKNMQEELQVYVKALAIGAAKGVIETRHHIEVARAKKARARSAS